VRGQTSASKQLKRQPVSLGKELDKRATETPTVAQRSLNQRPVVIYQDYGQRGWRVVISSCQAIDEGVRPQMPLAEARALLEHTDAHFEQYEPHRDRQALSQVAEWCQQFSPLIGLEDLEPPETLLLDITGCAHLFGGEVSLAQEAIDAFRKRQFFVRIAIADTIGAAWAISHYGKQTVKLDSVIVPPGAQEPPLRSLPIESLRLPANIIQLLYALGVYQVAQLQKLPRSSLPSRFGPTILTRLDQAMGHASELLTPERSPQPVEVEQCFEYPISDHRTLRIVVKQLIERAIEQLGPRQQGIQQFVCRFETADKQNCRFAVGLTRPSGTLMHLWALTKMQMDDLALKPDVTRVRLNVTETLSLATQQQTLFDSQDDHTRQRQFNTLIDRLSNRLGDTSVLRPVLCADAQPEFASRLETALQGQQVSGTQRLKPLDTTDTSCLGALGDASVLKLARPCCLKDRPIPVDVVSVIPEGPPIRFRSENQDHVVVRRWGPERIETGWWRSRQVRRDYYRVETATGQQFWLFRQTLDETWFLHGEFA
jgi:protein ImuB